MTSYDSPTRWLLAACPEEQKKEVEKLYELSSERLVDHILFNKPDATASNVIQSLAKIGRWSFKYNDRPDRNDEKVVTEAAQELKEILEDNGFAAIYGSEDLKIKMHSTGIAVMIIYERGPWEMIRLMREYLLPMVSEGKH